MDINKKFEKLERELKQQEKKISDLEIIFQSIFQNLDCQIEKHDQIIKEAIKQSEDVIASNKLLSNTIMKIEKIGKEFKKAIKPMNKIKRNKK